MFSLSVYAVATQVVDVAKAITNIIADPQSTAGKTYELTGSVCTYLVMLFITFTISLALNE